MRQGEPSKNFAHLGVWTICLGPHASKLQGEHLKIVIYDKEDRIVRTMEEVEGPCLKEGYADFFEDNPKCCASDYAPRIIDIAPNGTRTVLHTNPSQLAHDPEEWVAFVGRWARRHGVEQ